MGYLVIGFFLGVAVSWFWQNQYKGAPVFQQLMKKELAVNGQMGTIENLKKRLEQMEKRLIEMEKSAVDDETFPQEEKAPASPDEKTAPALTLINKEGRNTVKPDKSERMRECEKVILHWNEGKTITDIASITGLGKGEVDLIVSLKSSNLDAVTGSGKA